MPHKNILVIRGKAPCNNNCIFCVEKQSPFHQQAPNTKKILSMITANNKYTMLGFAAGEPTLNKDIFKIIVHAKNHGFQDFQIVSNFRALSKAELVLKFLKIGVRYFDISLHVCDQETAINLNKIKTPEKALQEALQGLKNLFILAKKLKIKIFITHKIVITPFNVKKLNQIFDLTFNLGIRNYLIQPLVLMKFSPDLIKKLLVRKKDTIPYLNELIKKAEKNQAKIKLYNYSPQELISSDIIEFENNAINNIGDKQKDFAF